MNKKLIMLSCLIAMFVCSFAMLIIGAFYTNPITSGRMLIVGAIACVISVFGIFYHRWINNPNN